MSPLIVFGLRVGRMTETDLEFQATCGVFVEYRCLAAAELQRREALS